MQKSALLRLLAELVRSFTAVANSLCTYLYRVGSIDAIEEDTTALAYILDKLLIVHETAEAARSLIGCIAACQHCQEAQNQLVTEVKLALQRACALPESEVLAIK